MTSKAKRIFLGALGAASYGTNPIFAIPLYNCGMDSESVLFFPLSARHSRNSSYDESTWQKFCAEKRRHSSCLGNGNTYGIVIIYAFRKLQIHGSGNSIHPALSLPHYGGSDNECVL